MKFDNLTVAKGPNHHRQVSELCDSLIRILPVGTSDHNRKVYLLPGACRW